jgi:molybdopterin synthase sulfur carrier subunit
MEKDTMEVKVLYFAKIREELGKNSETIRLTGKTTEDLRVLLKNKYPNLAPIIEISRIAVNGEYYEGPLREGDTVAIIPPVSGG